jgi:hypothetical protein
MKALSIINQKIWPLNVKVSADRQTNRHVSIRGHKNNLVNKFHLSKKYFFKTTVHGHMLYDYSDVLDVEYSIHFGGKCYKADNP